MSSARPGERGTVARTVLQQARVLLTAMVAVALVLTAGLVWVPRSPSVESLVLPAALAGAVSPVIGYRSYCLLRDRAHRVERVDRRCRAFRNAILAAAAVTEMAALFGLVVAGLSGRPLPLLGVVTHVLLAGVIWPTPERLELFVDPPPAAGPE